MIFKVTTVSNSFHWTFCVLITHTLVSWVLRGVTVSEVLSCQETKHVLGVTWSDRVWGPHPCQEPKYVVGITCSDRVWGPRSCREPKHVLDVTCSGRVWGPHSYREPKHVHPVNAAPTPLACTRPPYCRREDPQGPGYHSTAQVGFLNCAAQK